MELKGISPVIATILIVMVTVGLVAFSFSWFMGVGESGKETTMTTISQMEKAQQGIEIGTAYQCGGDICFELRASAMNSAKIPMNGLSAYLNDVPKTISEWKGYSPNCTSGKLAPGESCYGKVLFSPCNLGDELRISHPWGASKSTSISDCLNNKDLLFYESFEGAGYSPPYDTFTVDGWSVDQTPHCNHCGCPCNDWCGDSGVISADDNESAGYDCSAYSGTYTAYLRGDSTLTSLSIDLSGVSSAELSFYWKGHSFDGDTEKAYLEVYDGSSWNEIVCMEDSSGGVDVGCSYFDDLNWHKVNLDITPYLNSNFKLRFTGSPGSWDDLWVDKIKITK